MWSLSTLRRLHVISKHIRATELHVHTAAGSHNVKWLHPAEAAARRMEVAHRYGVLHYPIILTVNSKTPLAAKQVERALFHMVRKVPPMRTVFRYRGDVLWVCEDDSVKIDCEEVSGGDLIKQVEELMKIHYPDSSQSPLWRLRWYRETADSPCLLPEVKTRLPHQYVFVFSFHHGVADGSGCFCVTEAFIKILSDVVNGKPIDHEEQFGKIVSDEQTLLVKQDVKDYLLKNPKELLLVKENITKPNFEPLLKEAFGFPRDSNPRTRFLISKLESSVFDKFNEKCTEAGVTFNSGFTQVVNSALVELVKEAGVIRDLYSVTSRQSINLRRYWKKHKLWSYGCHTSRMYQTSDIPPYDKRVFWEQAKILNTQLQGNLKNKYALQEEVVKELFGIKPPNFEGKNPLPSDCDYFISNSYLPVSDILAVDENILVTSFLSFIEMHLSEYITFHLVASTPGLTTYTISYSTWHITDENAKKLLEKIEHIIKDLVA